MAIPTSKRSSSSSSNRSSLSTANVRASAYVGIPSPPPSPPLAAHNTSKLAAGGRVRRGGAAYTITEKCERLFCETLSSVFLGEGNLVRQDSLVMGVQYQQDQQVRAGANGRYPDRFMDSPSPDAVGEVCERGLVSDWLEVWDYVGGIRFRGFVAEKEGEKALFVFFDRDVIGGKIKAGLMALLELCEIDYFSCSRLVVCIDRHTDQLARDTLIKDLGWIGFELTNLSNFMEDGDIISDKWLFLEMET
ncbi:hypothetical protein K458DRAFT_437006 [Lentithecium fluviatile CBS 122367]|uniref:Ornithine decarboxylase antizyme n=1 Tax=Lentithecium fluviatile CBS 122367 TaxID=1168545 RepID=A0A6G1IF26_9PLEO|nr:hypothetical protein K458DRAFT_437006 [Lentithecium fluviatile CBS 122367]